MLRVVRAEDEHALLPIYTHRLVERFLTFDGVDAQRFSGIFSKLLEDGDFFVYEADDTVVGFCKATRLAGRSRHVAHLGPLAVAPEFHGRGYAAAMLRDVLAQLERSGVLRFELLVEADNSRGIAFYQKLGFEREGVQRKAYKRAAERDYVDEIMMVKFAGALA
ncbi:MAG TPA: GNAT family N-acetyltransferase [Steroidobacteraceae bacterium]|nr:GNAT family N-acetyltransferase [Steroidobacteraceae bacterium]